MHIAIVVTETRDWRSLAPARETEVTRRLAERQTAAGHDVTVFCTQFWDGYESTLRRDDVTYRSVTVAPATASFTARLPALVAAAQPDVVHAAPEPPSAVLAAKQGARLAGVPLVVGWEGHEDPSGRLLGRAARAPDGVVVPSGLVGTRARKAGTPERRVRTIPHPVDVEQVRAAEPTGGYDVVAATPLDEHANLEGLFLALAELRRRDWSALVVGSGGEEAQRVPSREEEPSEGDDESDAERDPTPRAAVDEQLADLRIDDRVTVVEDMDREERLAHYRGAHVFVQTRAREAFAQELLWALACGCVGIVEYQADSSAHELLVDHERGFRVTTPEEIRAAIRDAGEMERRDVDESFERHDWSSVVESYVEFYREVAADA
ncbi:glycosyltransferase family 4 protein [Halomarina oriensis]|uniref:Glycosyltransferase n=1 Tax=Halomarina oriensis TaxID=671145 RepID=A0A6B0GNM2_9EURY|nr:glycosyltransferase family 4 protein [Halomarina oriensis]MWG35187.1 glycosyltransferase [Halomarina oriensis]